MGDTATVTRKLLACDGPRQFVRLRFQVFNHSVFEISAATNDLLTG